METSISPNLNLNASTASSLANSVRSSQQARLYQATVTPTATQNIMAAAQPSPKVKVTNPGTVSIESFNPQPGNRLGMHTSVQVTNAPGPQFDRVSDALQRYFNVGPRYEPTADPKSEASVWRHPQEILNERQAWDDIFPYQFSLSGVSRYQKRPDFYMAGGSVHAKVQQFGVTGIEVPPSQAMDTYTVGPTTSYTTYPPAFAAQMAMQDLSSNIPPIEPEGLNGNVLTKLDSKNKSLIATPGDRTNSKGEPLLNQKQLVGPFAQRFVLGDPSNTVFMTSDKLEQGMQVSQSAQDNAKSLAESMVPSPSEALSQAASQTQSMLNSEKVLKNPMYLGPMAQKYSLGDPTTAAYRAMDTMKKLEIYRNAVVVGAFSAQS